MKFLLIPPLMVMIIAFNAGCSMLVDNNETKQISVVESQDKKNEMEKVDNHLIAAKQALSTGDYTKTIEEATASIKDTLIVPKLILCEFRNGFTWRYS